MHRHFCPGTQPAFKAGKHAFDQPVKPDGSKVRAVRFHADPAVIIKNVCFLAEGVDDIHQCPGLFRHKALGKIHIIPFAGSRRPVRCLEPAFIDEVLSGQRVSVFLFKGLQGSRAHRKIIACPVDKTGTAAHIASENPDEVVEQGGQPDYVCIRIMLTPVPEPVLQVFPRFRMPGIQLAQVFTLPVVGCVVVHVDLFPDPPRQEGDGISVVQGAVVHRHPAVRIFPFFIRENPVFRPVPDLPVCHRFRRIIDFELLVKIPVQRVDDQCFRQSCLRFGKQEGLLLCIRMGAGKLIVFPDNTDRGIDPVSGFRDLRRQLRSVGITDHIRAPLFCHLQGKLLIACFTGKRETAGSIILHCDSPVLCQSVVRDRSLYCILPDRNSRFRAFFTDCIAVSPINLFQL